MDLPTLISNLKSPDPTVRLSAADALGQAGGEVGAGARTAASTAVPALMVALSDPERQVRQGAAHALRAFGPYASPATPALIAALLSADNSDAKNPQNNNIRMEVVTTLWAIGPQASAAVPALIAALEDPDDFVRREAAIALGAIGPEANAAIPALVKTLHNPDTRLPSYASGQTNSAYALGDIGPQALPALLVALKDSDASVRRQAAFAVARMGGNRSAAVPAMTAALADPDGEVRLDAAECLGFMRPEARKAVPALAQALSDPIVLVRVQSALSLGRIGPPAGQAVPALTKALKDINPDVRQSAGQALGKIGPEAISAIPGLIEALKGSDVNLRNESARTLIGLVETCRDMRRTDAIEPLSAIPSALDAAGLTTSASQVRTALTLLQSIQQPWYERVYAETIERHGVVGLGVFYFLLLLVYCCLFGLGCVALLVKSPLALWKINQKLEPLPKVKLPGWLGGVEISVANLLLVGFFQYHPRVLDAWLAKHMLTLRDHFGGMTTVKERDVFVGAPVELDHLVMSELQPGDLKATFGRKRACILIWAEGGAGKTSLACQIARWAMSEDEPTRPSQHRMLPILIEQDLNIEVEKDKDIMTEMIRGQLKDMLGEAEAPPAQLVVQLLKQQRILLLIDGLSELSASTRNKIRPVSPNFMSNAFIITSRMDEGLDGITKTTLHPMRIQGNRLSSFMDKYLDQKGKRQLFDDVEFFNACGKFSLMVGDRDTTALLLKLYADQMIVLKERPADPLPENIPDLMLDYLNELNRKESQVDGRVVQMTAKAVAWECLRQTYRPIPAQIDAVLDALGRGEGAEGKIKYLEQNLRLIQTIGPGRDQIKFLLDPLSEYLAALYLVERYRDCENLWVGFLKDVDAAPGAPATIMGFLLAVHDCCVVKGARYSVPNFVASELGNRIRLDSTPQMAPASADKTAVSNSTKKGGVEISTPP